MKRLLVLLLFYTSAYAQSRYSVIINEVMVDPAPQIGLPNNEWIELKNVSGDTINLQYFRVADNNSQSGSLPAFRLEPDSLVIICATSAAPAMVAFGRVIPATNFPSLDNEFDHVLLKDPSGNIIHAINYNSEWYRNEIKKDGGWSLEMIDPNNYCIGQNNWKASMDPMGGSPGKRNSVNALNPDEAPPRIERTYYVNDSSIVAVFNEPLDSVSGTTKTNFSMNNNLLVARAEVLAPLFNNVKLSFSDTIAFNKIYELTVANIKDCKNNFISSANKVLAGKPSIAILNDVVFNELLFNPRSTGEDYLELYNRSSKIIEASTLHLANRNSGNVISNVKHLSSLPWLIFPGNFVVATVDDVGLGREYLVSEPGWVFKLPSLPSMPDDKGQLVLLTTQGSVIDEISYSRNWHFKLIANDEGVALERIDPNAETQNESNWHSAASTCGYGTPTARNSQFKSISGSGTAIYTSPKIFSPDNDGRDDFVTIHYKMSEPGFVANVTLFDVAGRSVKSLVRNQLLGAEGYWNWNGLDDLNLALPIGPYIIYFELYNTRGQVERHKNVVYIAGRW